MDDWSDSAQAPAQVKHGANHHPRPVTSALTRPAPSWMTCRGLLECAAAAGGGGRRLGQPGERRRCSAHTCSSGNGPGRSACRRVAAAGVSGTRFANPRRAAGATRLPAYLRSAGRSRRGGCGRLCGSAGEGRRCCGPGSARRARGVGHERGAESSSMRASAGPRRCGGDRRVRLTSSARSSGCGWRRG
jgi:hypothetical protein